MKVFTTKGLIELDQLRVEDHIELGDNYRKVIVKYSLGDELVRQSVFIDVLRPLQTEVEHGKIS